MKFDTSFSEYGMLRQSRLETLISEGLQCSLLLIESAPGYGKSEAVSSCLQQSMHNYIWVRLRDLDNWEFFFWKHFVASCSALYPDLNEKLKKLYFPDTPGRMSNVLTLLKTAMSTSNVPTVIIFDDYSILTNENVLHFIDNLIQAELQNTCLVMISNQHTHLFSMCMRNNVNMFCIREKELALNAADVKELFKNNGVELADETAKEIVEKWEGWPLAIFLLAEQAEDPLAVQEKTMDFIYDLFYRDYYSTYPETTRKVLIQLSLIERFDIHMVNALAEQAEEFEMMLAQNPFVYHDYASGTYQFKKLYHHFLTGYQNELRKQEKQAVYGLAADLLYQKEQLEDMLPFLQLSGQYKRMTEIIIQLLTPYTDQSKVKFLEHYFMQIPSQYIQDKPDMELLSIFLKLMRREIETAEKSLQEFLKKHEGNPRIDRSFLGEAYIMLACISMIHMCDDSLEYLRKACIYLPNGSRRWRQQRSLLMNAGYLKLPDNKPGTLQRVGKLYAQSQRYMQILLQRKNTGEYTMFWAEAAFLTYQLEQAQIITKEMILLAEQEDQPELLLLGHYLLTRIAMLTGHQEQAETELQLIEHYITEHRLDHIKGMYDRLYALYCIYLNQPEKVPKKFTENGGQEGSRWGIARNAYVRASYLLKTGQYVELIALVDYQENICLEEGYWQHLVYLRLFRGIAQLNLGHTDTALAELYAVYDMTYANHIITPFIECAGGMRTLLSTARKQMPERFSAGWMDTVYAKASGYARIQTMIHKRYREQHAPRLNLTPRRRQILFGLAHGYTLEEIAHQNQISINTVKTHVQNIYNQLGAVNRADAIRIATERGILDKDEV